ncbi:hypothetical protein G647_02231 [Cladophialophora carrionii CBS 160.54]|uniref:Hemerythrin-like domain-containing protein n=1 Tax=Cladophialophora carrionii CBS 160.54 TaxID=1279043 RepID=V9DGL8_9EURO|nr:uncharacterized protein G647_02231 [Cladophialophora carrionii CBS 160.54]ETI25458.1 hypothetical protein G647_02231 [Cladophialophora carrionii CBS 160.54]
MAATRPFFRALVASPRCSRPLGVRASILPLSQQRFQSLLSQDTINKVDAKSADISSANAGTVSEAIKHDHAELKEYYNNILNATDTESKIRWQNQFTWELARHSIGEELVVYPAMEEHLGDEGKQLAQKDRDGHNKVKQLLYKFQGLAPSSKDFEPTIKSLWEVLTKHIEEEESDDLPKLEKAIPDGNSSQMAKSFERTKMFVPTRSHPSAPDKPPFETVAGLMAAPLDKLSDIFRRFPQ